MSKPIVPQQSRLKRLQHHLTGLKDLYEEPLEKMIYYAYEEFDATYTDIARALGQSPQAIMQRYPKKKEKHGK